MSYRHRRQWHRSVLGVAAVAAASPIGLAGLALGQSQDAPSPWRVECGSDGTALNCSAIQEATRANERQTFAAVAVRTDASSKTSSMLIQVPLGVNLLEPIEFRIDNGAVEKQVFQTCTPVGCFASLQVNDKLMGALRRGTVLKLTVQDVAKRPITVDVSLMGFSQAVDKTK